MKPFPRHIIAWVLTAIYLAITFSPLAHLATQSATIEHTVTGECTGDCATCGCSTERMASHTCCCWQKRLQDNDQHHGHEGCDISGGSSKKMPATKATLSGNCPCGSDRHLSLWGGEKLALLPYKFDEEIYSPQEGPLSGSFHPQSATRDREPPDPPPKLPSLA